MATDIINETLPGDNVNSPDINFQNDTTSGSDISNLDYQELTDGQKQLQEIDDEVKSLLYPEPKDYEFVFGQNFDKGMVGINSSTLGLIIGQVLLPLAPTITENTQNVSGMYGQRWLGNNYGAKVFNIPATIIADDENDYLNKVESISNALISVSNSEVPLRFGQYPERTYYGHFTAIPEPQYIDHSWNSSITLQFTCSDPHGYMNQEIGQADNKNELSLMPLGNDIAKPVFQYTFKSDANNFGYVNDKGENVFVGFSDDSDAKDLTPVVYTDPMEDLSTLTKVTDMGTQNFALANAQVTSDGTVKIAGGTALANDKFWVVPKNYTGQATMFGNLLTTKKFNVGTTGDWRLSTRMAHRRYYNRAYQRIEAYILGTDGHKIGRFGIQDYGTGGLTYIYVLYGSTISEEQNNLAKGFGYWGTGNTAWANAQIVQKPGTSVSINVTNETPNLTLDRKVTTDFTQVLYDDHKADRNPSHTTAQWGIKYVHTKQTTEEWKTPRDSSGKAIGKQQYTSKITVDTLSSNTVRVNRLDRGKNENLNLQTYQDIIKRNYVWGSSIGLTEYIETWHNVGSANPGYGNGWKWRTTDHKYDKWVDQKSQRNTQLGSFISTVAVDDHNDSSAVSDFWGTFVLTKIGNTIKIKVNEIRGGLATDNVVLDETWTIPNGFDAKLGQIGYYFGKAPIHEDKITKTTPAKDDIPASYEFVKSYSDDSLTVTHLNVQGITTADALKKAHTIIHAGDTATIDVEKENVYINGALANQYLSPASTYPALKGGEQETINFFPTADKATVKYVYRPAMK